MDEMSRGISLWIDAGIDDQIGELPPRLVTRGCHVRHVLTGNLDALLRARDDRTCCFDEPHVETLSCA